MRAPSTRERGSLEFNMTPMIDVSFLLIIFFLVSSHLAQQEVQLELQLPLAESSAAPGEDQLRRVTINVSADGQYFLGSQPVDRAQLAQAIGFEAAEHGKDLEVRIRCDRDVPYPVVEPLMWECATHGVWRVSFAVSPRQSAQR